MPRLDQLGQKQVHLFKLKISTPSRIASMMLFLDVWKAASNSGDHVNLWCGLKNGLKGAIVSCSNV